jgi:hypothetical protein
MSGYPKSVQHVAADNDHVVVTFRAVVICIWLRETHVRSIDQLAVVLNGLSDRYDRVGFVQVIERGSRSLDSNARNALAQLLARGRGRIQASAVICDGEGFRAAAVRMIVSSLAQLSNPGYPHNVYADTHSAARLIATKLTDDTQRADEMTGALEAAIASVRANARDATAAAG